MLHLTTTQAQEFYAVHKERPFYKDLVSFMTTGPVLVMVLEGTNAINKNRDIMGATDPKKAAPGTIRADFATSIDENAVHGSDASETATKEMLFSLNPKKFVQESLIMLLMIDNHDSFTYNLVHSFQKLGENVEVVTNDISIRECFNLKPNNIVISPGPGSPKDAGVSIELILACAGKIPLLGICLGHQALAQAFGGNIRRAANVMHGFLSEIHHVGRGVL